MEEKIRILCVDDEKNVLKALERLFLDDSYEIITANSGKEGLDILKKISPIQIVISDYRMPEMDGVDFLREVYQGWQDTVRIVLSGYADTAAIVSAINEGHIYRFIPKPWNDDELKVTISNALEKYFLHKRNISLTNELKIKNSELKKLNDDLEEMVTILRNYGNGVDTFQMIIDFLPIAVIGIDSADMIYQCNEKGIELFSKNKISIIGNDRRDSLPAEINDFIEEVMIESLFCKKITIGNIEFKAKGKVVKQSDGGNSIILILYKDTDNG